MMRWPTKLVSGSMDAHFKIVCMALGKQENSLAAAAALGPSTALNIR